MLGANFEPGDWSGPLEKLLGSHAHLTDAHLAFLRSRLGAIRNVAADEPLYGRARGEERPILLASGWAGAIAPLADERRQIVALFLPGDVVVPQLDLRTGLEGVAFTNVRVLEAGDLAVSLTGAQTAATEPLAEAWTAARAAIDDRLVRHIVRLGRLSAYERTADLILELHDRQHRAGLADGRGMHLPLTQEVLADHLGLSVVHMNRTMQQLRRDRLIVNRGGRLVMLDPEGLAQATRRQTAS